MMGPSRPTMRSLLRLATLAILALAVAIPATAKKPETEDEKTLYFLGVLAGQSLTRFHLEPDEVEIVKQGLSDSLSGEAMELDRATYGEAAQALLRTRQAKIAAVEKEASAAFIQAEAAKEGVRTLPSGVLIEDLVAGTGEQPTVTDTVEVHYHGTLRDGTVFDSSVERGQTFKTPLGRVVRCWQEGVAAMRVGGKSRLICPSDLAYGDSGAPPSIPGGAALVFEVELIGIEN